MQFICTQRLQFINPVNSKDSLKLSIYNNAVKTTKKVNLKEHLAERKY